MDEDDKLVKDVEWQNIEKSAGEIKFRKKNRIIKFNKASKGIAFVLIAVLSGGISGGYIANKTFSELKNSKDNSSVIQGNKSSGVDVPGSEEASNENAISEVAENVSQSVVEITNSNTSSGQMNLGSGVIFKENGYIITNYHVIENSSDYFVKLDSKTLKAKVIGYDKITDLAVLKINAKNLPAATFANSSDVQLGDYVVAVGSPNGNTTTGIVSSTNRKMKKQDSISGLSMQYDVIQTDATINPGNTGGALCNLNGEVIGISSMNIGTKDQNQGVNFAVAINEVKSVANSIIKSGRVIRPYLGFTIEDEGPQDKDDSKWQLVIKAIVKGSKAEKSEAKVNDIITEVDGVKIHSSDELNDILSSRKVGDSLPIQVNRDGKVVKYKVTLSEEPNS